MGNGTLGFQKKYELLYTVLRVYSSFFIFSRRLPSAGCRRNIQVKFTVLPLYFLDIFLKRF